MAKGKYEAQPTGDGRFEIHGPDGATGEYFDRMDLAEARMKEMGGGEPVDMAAMPAEEVDVEAETPKQRMTRTGVQSKK